MRRVGIASTGAALDLLANEEEGCLYAGRAKTIEHGRSGLRMGSIVEGE